MKRVFPEIKTWLKYLIMAPIFVPIYIYKNRELPSLDLDFSNEI